jgi:hypothetical protein
MVRHAVFMYDADRPDTDPVPASQSGYSLEDVINRVNETITDPGTVWYGWEAVVDPFPFVPAN